MNGYLKPLRRKLGMLTLLMACAFMGGWVRNEFVDDHFRIVTSSKRYLVASIRGNLIVRREILERTDSRGSYWKTSVGATRGRTLESDEIARCNLLFGRNIEWQRDCFGIHFGAGRSSSGRVLACSLHYWNIVPPLTLLSSWLLLSKPRQSIKAKVADPSPSGGI